MKNKVILLLTLLVSTTCSATSYVVWGTTITTYVQSRAESTANMIQSEKGIYNNGNHPWCGKRAYIEFDDKQLLSTALAASVSKQKVNFIYEDAAATRSIAGHTQSRCKVISIFQ